MRAFKATSVLVTGAVILIPFMARANSGGPTSGNSGDPVFNRDCRNCHTGNPLNSPGVTFAIGVPGAAGSMGTYVPGSFLPVTVSLSGQLQSNRSGYQISSWKNPALTFQDLLSGFTRESTTTQRSISFHVSHSLGGNLQQQWRQYYQFPAASQNLTFYAAGNDTNDNGRNSGDKVYKTKVDMFPGAVPLSMRAIPRPGGTVPLDLHAPNDPNRSYIMAVSLSNAGIPVGSRVIPLFPDTIFFVTLSNFLPTVTRNYQGVLDANGRATATLDLTSLTNPALQGITLHHAFVVLNPASPNGISTISNGLPVLII